MRNAYRLCGCVFEVEDNDSFDTETESEISSNDDYDDLLAGSDSEDSVEEHYATAD